MCGIAGGWVPDDRIAGTLAALRHRGPDDSGHERIGELVLVHTRLSIIDLSSGGHQPMRTPDGRFTLVYNGELYNYVELRDELARAGVAFRSGSDTEVLLAAWARWGRGALPRFKGMFAFAVHDARDATLTCVRDAFGIKPLYFRADGSGFAFASEIAALRELCGMPFAPDLQRVHDYLVYGVCDGEQRTFFDGVHQLLPGQVVTFDIAAGRLGTPERWWWPDIRERAPVPFEDAAAELRERFLTNVRMHLRSDVPVGCALSGGIDSSAAVCAMRVLEPDLPIHTFTFAARGSDRDEERWADIVNAHVRATAHKVVVTPDELAADLDDMIRVQGEPFGGTSIYAQYRVYRLARENGIKVTLDGQGADELLAGYDRYPLDRLHGLAERGGHAAALRLARSRNARTLLPYYAAKLMPAWLRDAIPARLKDAVGGNAPAARASYLRAHQFADDWPPAMDLVDARGRRLMARLRDELMVASIPHLLRYGDRNAMRWSVEARVPFLTTDLAAFLYGLPEQYLLSDDGVSKAVFRAAMRGIVPDAILDRRDKVGFETPERGWLQGLGGRIGDWLGGLDAIPFVDTTAARREVDAMVAGQQPYSPSAWRLINLSRWAQLNA